MALGLSFGAAPGTGLGASPQPATAAPAASPPSGAPAASPAPAAPAASAKPAAPAAEAGPVEPGALEALNRMDAYLATLTSFELVSDFTLDVVMNSGQRVQLGGQTRYKVHRPDGFQIDLTTDFRQRKFYFDGKNFTVFAPELGYYATREAPPTIREVLDVLYDKLGISLPLEDLFRWGDSKEPRSKDITSAFKVGPAIIDGSPTDHYAFREGDHDWEVWIQQGDKPLPRKLAIVDQKDPDKPAYSARLTWNEHPTIAASEFTFVPGKDAKQIRMAVLGD
jgi:hypothetical protein